MVLFSAFADIEDPIEPTTNRALPRRTGLLQATPAIQVCQSCEQTQPSTESTEIPRAIWCDPFLPDTRPLLTDTPPKPNSKMASFCYPCYPSSDFRSCSAFANPDMYTSAGLVANAYSRFKTRFWLDRVLIWLTVVIPISEAIVILLVHTFLGVARCVQKSDSKMLPFKYQVNEFVDRVCGLQLTSNILKGESLTTPVQIAELGSIQFQHECYPFILLIVAILMWIPHYLHQRTIDKTARRDLCLVRSELHSFRRAVGQELNYLQAASATSIDGVVAGGVSGTTAVGGIGGPAPTFLSPESTMPPGQRSCATMRYKSGGPSLVTQPHSFAPGDGNSGRTTAATVGETSLLSHTPAATVIHAHQSAPQQSATLITNRGGLFGFTNLVEASPAPLPLSYGDADFSAPGLLDLPCFHACHADWSLNTYLSAWQNTDFYWRHYLAKHCVLAVFKLVLMITLFALIGLSRGAVFTALFTCHIDLPGQSVTPVVCMLQTTFLLNMSLLSWSCLSLIGLSLQAIYWYTNFIRSIGRSEAKDADQYLGIPNKPSRFVNVVDETKRCFFADYIHLLAYAAFRDSQCEIRSLSVTYSTQLYGSDFHFISMLCAENAHLFPDAIHIHFWTERYARLHQRRFRRPYWAIRRGSFGHLVRCEDLSMKFNFSKIRIKVEVNDFGF